MNMYGYDSYRGGEVEVLDPQIVEWMAQQGFLFREVPSGYGNGISSEHLASHELYDPQEMGASSDRLTDTALLPTGSVSLVDPENSFASTQETPSGAGLTGNSRTPGLHNGTKQGGRHTVYGGPETTARWNPYSLGGSTSAFGPGRSDGNKKDLQSLGTEVPPVSLPGDWIDLGGPSNLQKNSRRTEPIETSQSEVDAGSQAARPGPRPLSLDTADPPSIASSLEETWVSPEDEKGHHRTSYHKSSTEQGELEAEYDFCET